MRFPGCLQRLHSPTSSDFIILRFFHLTFDIVNDNMAGKKARGKAAKAIKAQNAGEEVTNGSSSAMLRKFFKGCAVLTSLF